MSTRPRVRLVTGADLPRGDGETRFLAARLRERGWTVDVAVWSDPSVGWGDAPLTVIRSTWDYPAHLDDFLAWAEATAEVTALHNPPVLVRRNVDKRYLFDLRATGIPIVPSRWVAALDGACVDAVADEEGWGELVAKPAVGVDGLGVVRLRPGGPPADVDPRPAGWLLQPYVDSVASVGERSVVLIDGRPTHAVAKHPRAGDFRVQERWGGRTVEAAMEPETDRIARRTLEAFVGDEQPPPLYARIDLMRHGGAWCVAEVEVVEPSFYLEGVADRVSPLERALRIRLP